MITRSKIDEVEETSTGQLRNSISFKPDSSAYSNFEGHGKIPHVQRRYYLVLKTTEEYATGQEEMYHLEVQSGEVAEP